MENHTAIIAKKCQRKINTPDYARWSMPEQVWYFGALLVWLRYVGHRRCQLGQRKRWTTGWRHKREWAYRHQLHATVV